MQALQRHLNRWLLGYSVAVMVVALAVGYPAETWAKMHKAGLGTLTTVAVFLIIYPMMVNVRFDALAKAGRKVKSLSLALAFNFVWAPVVGYVLARLLLHDPTLSLGFLLVMVVPCSSMSIAYTGLAEGDIELATVIVAASFVLSVGAVPLWMSIFASRYHVPVPMHDLLVSIVTVLIAPMILGYLTRRFLTRSRGEQAVKRLQPLLASMSMLAMFTIIFLIFFAKTDMILAKWATVLLLLVPNALFIGVTLLLVTFVDRWLRLSYRDHMAVVFASTGKNNGTAVAIAAMAFSPLVAVPAATMPIFQIMLLVVYLKLAPRLRDYFDGVTPSSGDAALSSGGVAIDSANRPRSGAA
jgi:ACR3 family arsenite efflux pump ArsB